MTPKSDEQPSIATLCLILRVRLIVGAVTIAHVPVMIFNRLGCGFN